MLERLYPLIYQFALTAMKCDEERDPSYPHVKYERNVVSVTGQVSPLCDSSLTIEKVRGPKCLLPLPMQLQDEIAPGSWTKQDIYQKCCNLRVAVYASATQPLTE